MIDQATARATGSAVNRCEDQMGMRTGMDATFGLHHAAQHNAEVGADSLAGMDARSMKKASA